MRHLELTDDEFVLLVQIMQKGSETTEPMKQTTLGLMAIELQINSNAVDLAARIDEFINRVTTAATSLGDKIKEASK